MNILKLIWKYFSGAIRAVFTLIKVLILVVIGVAVLNAMIGQAPPTVPEGSALVLAPSGVIVEQLTARDPIQKALLSDQQPQETLIRDVLQAIQLGAEDDQIAALVLATDQFVGAGPSKLHDIANAIAAFRESGKPVIAVGSFFGQSAYLLAAQADEVYLHPYGGVALSGYGAFRAYYKSGLDKLNARMEIFRAGAYKSFGEPYVRDTMSDEAREANLAYLTSLWDDYVKSVSAGRDLEPEKLNEIISSADTLLVAAGGDTARMALEAGLVDTLVPRDGWRKALTELVGENEEGTSFLQIHFTKYLRAKRFHERAKDAADEAIAIIVARGEILDGEQPAGTAGGDTIARHIRDARENEDVKAIVLRVDSPGGSVFASEIIRREIDLAREAGKPVIASMGSVAASGGYWISASADEIWASPTTITGSIGVFAAVPDISGTLDMLGVHTDGVGTTPWSGQVDISRPLPEGIKTILQSSVDNTYRKFISLIAANRDLTPEQVEAVAGGRVWAGTTAFELGLVDSLGNLEDAIAAAATRAEIDNYRLIYFQDKMQTPAEFIESLINNAKVFGGTEEITELHSLQSVNRQSPIETVVSRTLRDLTHPLRMNDPNNIYAICLSCAAH